VSRSLRISVSTVVGVLLFIPAAALSQTGTISGVVHVEGTVPAPKMLDVTTDKELCGTTIPASDVIIDDRRVAFAVIAVNGVEGPVVPSEIILSNVECGFDPPVLAGVVGSTLVVNNQDDVMHNTHLNLRYGAERTRTIGNSTLPPGGGAVRSIRAFRWPGIVDVECDVHSWMHSKIMVFDHPYFAVTDKLGVFAIAEVPVGTHTITVWHEVFGELQQSITVAANATTSVSFNFSADAVRVGEGRN
jgi:hypothetical protein